MSSLLAVIVVAALAGPGAATSAAPPYTAVDLGTLGTTSYAVDINAGGQVVGYSYTASAQKAFSWTKAAGMVDVGTLGGNYTYAQAVNDSGQVVGESTSPAGIMVFSWTPSGGMVALGTLPDAISGTAWAVNDAGMVAGDAYVVVNGAGYNHAVVWRPGETAPIDLGGPLMNTTARAINGTGEVIGFGSTQGGTPAGFSWTEAGGMAVLNSLPGGDGSAAPRAVNDNGVIVGSSYNGEGTRATLWTADQQVHDLGWLGCGYSEAVAVSDSGHVAGNSRTADCDVHAFAWTDATGLSDLGTLGGTFSQATAVNEHGQVVGFSTTAAGETHAFSWTPAGGMVDLGTLGGSSSYAFAVNDSGQVAGYGDTADGTTHAALWNPASDTTPPTLAVPGNVTVDATSPSGAVVAFTVSASDNVDPAPSVGCTPTSGAMFPIGDTTVACIATDTSGNASTASFGVHVRGAAEQLTALRARVATLGLRPLVARSLDAELQAAQVLLLHGQPKLAAAVLMVFNLEVRLLPRNAIAPAEAAKLVADANRVIAVLGLNR